MIKKYENKMLQVNQSVRGLVKDTKISVKVDKNGTPTDKVIRDCVRDAAIDNCVSWDTPKTEVKKEDKNGGNT